MRTIFHRVYLRLCSRHFSHFFILWPKTSSMLGKIMWNSHVHIIRFNENNAENVLRLPFFNWRWPLQIPHYGEFKSLFLERLKRVLDKSTKKRMSASFCEQRLSSSSLYKVSVWSSCIRSGHNNLPHFPRFLAIRRRIR